jgi:hypothetical protein
VNGSIFTFGELHRVQVLLAKLALRVDSHGGQQPGKAAGSGEDLNRNTKTDEFSTAALGQMQTDLQNFLSWLSSDIISILRHW